ncbi:Methyltransferase [Labilithrix luteola]|uniref:Methyltransferase n=1 Tax=Labilithrix luteola TaxID=1391654 RepID=A0A0K1Q1F7_9BACT|nr:class I SAM-dependent methyltransferase [Labilithrix luteola]AKU99572.1 Methyltransferase [Labilithrix luteola]
MAQNIYDQDDFFAAYGKLDRSLRGLQGAPEWPALRALVPDLQHKRVVDLGCGFGWFCRWAADQGAAHVLGLDLSENMLARAHASTSEPGITYERADLEAFTLPESAFDVVYSSLTIHYLANLEALFAKAHRALVEGGTFVFSVEHPLFTAPSEPSWLTDEGGRTVWPLDDYLAEGPRVTNWLAPGVVKQHHTIATYVNSLLRVGFALVHLEEWAPTDAQIEEHPDWAVERHRPPFMLVCARRP